MTTRRIKMTEQIGLRLEPELMAEIDQWLQGIRPRPSRSAAARELIIEGLASFRRKAAEGEKPAKSRKA
jgi:metal-responsive CopG/Arc/MetJ family transcriptional regulator